MHSIHWKTHLWLLFILCWLTRARADVWTSHRSITHEKPSPFFPNEFGDRFIPRRYSMSDWSRCVLINKNATDNQLNLFNLKDIPGYWRLHNYRENIKNHIGLNSHSKVLDFHDYITRMRNDSVSYIPRITLVQPRLKNVEGLDWACHPRPVPLAINESTHNLPRFNKYKLGHNIIDWSKAGIIAAAFNMELVLWGPTTISDRNKFPSVYRMERITALAFSDSGKELALGINELDHLQLQVWSVSSFGIYLLQICKLSKRDFFDEIRTIEWDPLSEYLICGTLSGCVAIAQLPSLTLETRFRCYFDCITNIKFSCHRKFLAFNNIKGELSFLRRGDWSHFLKHKNAMFFAWHPWNETDILIGHGRPAKISLLDLKTKTIVAYYQHHDETCSVKAMSLNPLSAELVVSFTHKSSDGKKNNEILVLASMNRVTDNISAHNLSVHFLLWNPTGTHIATAGRDDTLNIWDFFGMSKKIVNDLSKLRKKQNASKENPFDLKNVFLQSR